MTLPTFKDHNPANPWTVTAEQHTVGLNGQVRLVYAPKKDSIVIAGFTETQSTSPGLTEFYCDYQDATDYRTAQQILQFSMSQSGTVITVNYQGVSQVVIAEHMNEIKAHDENTSMHLSSAQATALATLTNQVDTKTYFVPSGFTYAPPTREDMARTTNQLWIDCCDATGSPQNPTSFVAVLWKNGSSVYTSSAVTTASTVLTVNISTVAGDLLVWKLSNTAGITGGVSVTRRMVMA